MAQVISQKEQFEIDLKNGIHWCKGYTRGCRILTAINEAWCLRCREKRRIQEQTLQTIATRRNIIINNGIQ